MLESLIEFRVQIFPLGTLALVLVALVPHTVQVQTVLVAVPQQSNAQFAGTVVMQTREAVMHVAKAAHVLTRVHQVQSARGLLLLLQIAVMKAVVLLMVMMVVVVMMSVGRVQHVEILTVMMVLLVVVLLFLQLQAHYRVDEVRAHAHRIELDPAGTVGTAVARATAGKAGPVDLKLENFLMKSRSTSFGERSEQSPLHTK